MKRILVLTLLLMAGTASALTIHVPDDFATIQAALNRANPGDTVLVADGVYTGSGNTNLDFSGNDIVLISENGPEYTFIDCESATRGFYLHSGETSAAEIIGFAVVNGYQEAGGGVHIENAGPTFKNCIIADCASSTQGGGVYSSDGSPTFINCVLHNNYASEGGGMSADNSNITVNSCVVAANSSSG